MDYDHDTSFCSKAVESVFSLPLCIAIATLLWFGDTLPHLQPFDVDQKMVSISMSSRSAT